MQKYWRIREHFQKEIVFFFDFLPTLLQRFTNPANFTLHPLNLSFLQVPQPYITCVLFETTFVEFISFLIRFCIFVDTQTKTYFGLVMSIPPSCSPSLSTELIWTKFVVSCGPWTMLFEFYSRISLLSPGYTYHWFCFSVLTHLNPEFLFEFLFFAFQVLFWRVHPQMLLFIY